MNSTNVLFRRAVLILAKKYGLTLRADAAAVLKELLTHHNYLADDDASLTNSLDDIAQAYMHHQGTAGQIVDAKNLRQVIASLSNAANANTPDDADINVADMQAHLHVVNLFKVHKWDYSVDARVSPEPLQLHATAAIQSHVLRDRYEIIRQRIMRNENFRPPTFAATRSIEYYEITPIKNLSGCQSGTYLLFGMLTQMREGAHHLEDPGAFIELEFSGEIQQTVGLFTHNCFVLVEGEYTDRKTFKVAMIGMPPSETRAETISTFGYNADMFGAPREASSLTAVAEIEKDAVNVSFAIFSDVWLDDSKVLAKLRIIFEQYSSESSYIPLAFIFLGNFSSNPYIYNSADFLAYKDLFKILADLIHEFPAINRQSQFIFVPGPTDPWGGSTIPRAPIPETFLARIRAKVPNALFTSNPTR
ncbi:DNA polymerase epsilon subunit 2 [Physocladia obscura]|uniref:DNA polymerase epsilon subunit B n=1 Tax=Physocladia obscura TaxID=109957 RepID=A0AAD5XKJ2_9FUNG|nr:DNA polymerase epsilon subunit 2 [Physocladia obscura]